MLGGVEATDPSKEWKLRFQGTFKRISEQNFTNFITNNGAPWLVAVGLAKVGFQVQYQFPEASDPDLLIEYEGSGFPLVPRTRSQFGVPLETVENKGKPTENTIVDIINWDNETRELVSTRTDSSKAIELRRLILDDDTLRFQLTSNNLKTGKTEVATFIMKRIS